MHDLMRHKFLWYVEEEVCGETLRPQLVSTTAIGRDIMADYMHRVECWAADMGVLLPVPADNEYAKYREAMQ